MYKLVTAVIAGTLVSGSVLAQVPMKVAVDTVQATSKDQNRNEGAGKLRAGSKAQAARNQPSPSPRNAAFIVFLSLVYGRK